MTPTKLTFLKMTGWPGDSNIGTLIHFRWLYKLVLPLRKHYGKHGDPSLPFGPVMPVFAMSTKEHNLAEATGYTQSTVLQSVGH